MKKNESIHLEILGVDRFGSGIGISEGMRVAVPLTVPKDVAQVKILKIEGNNAFGKLEDLIVSSPDRTASPCPVFDRCGGCSYHHMSYEAELRIKQEMVAAVLDGYEIRPIIAAERTEGYRNKAGYPVASGKDALPHSGFYARRSHSIVASDRCLVQDVVADRIKALVLSFMRQYGIDAYDEQTRKGLLRHIFVRVSSIGEVMVVLVINGVSVPHSDELITLLCSSVKNVKSIGINSNSAETNVILGEKSVTLFGSDTISDVLCGYTFAISAHAFYQVNHDQSERLYNHALQLADVGKEDTCLDLFCGIGTITTLLAARAKKAYGVEKSPAAIKNARYNAQMNNIENVEFICATAEEATKRLHADGVAIDLLVVDPPRKGLDRTLIDLIQIINPKKMIYISCDVETFARDLNILKEHGFVAGGITPVDMFPRTPHVECCCLLSRIELE